MWIRFIEQYSPVKTVRVLALTVGFIMCILGNIGFVQKIQSIL